MAKKNIWTDSSRYGTYKGEKGNSSQWSSTFNVAFEKSESVHTILGMSAFSILEIEPAASDNEVKKAYRKFAKLHHPDLQNGNAELFQKYTRAYESIKNQRQNLKQRKRKVVAADDDINETQSQHLVIPQLLSEINESEIEYYLSNPDFGCQEKKDGKHLTLQILDDQLIVRNKKGISCGCAPEFESSLRLIGFDLLIDGEQINGKFWVWDILEFDGHDFRQLSYLERYQKLSTLNFGPTIKILPLAITEKEKRDLFLHIKTSGKEGIVFKKLSALFSTGKGDDQFKFKFYAECSVIVVTGRQGRASIGMELIDENGQRVFVGYCSCNRNPQLGSIAEIKYLYAYRGGCMYQSSFKEIRDDVDVDECLLSQLKYKFEE